MSDTPTQPPISTEMQQQLNVPTDLDKVPQFVDSADHADPRQQTIDRLGRVDEKMLSAYNNPDEYGTYLQPNERKALVKKFQENPRDPLINQMDEVVKGRIAQKQVAPMTPEQWEATRQYAGDAALKTAAPEHLEKIGGEAIRKIGTDSFDNLYGKHQKYLVQQPKGNPNTPENDKALQEMPLVAPRGAEGAANHRAPKTTRAAEGSGPQFANSLLDIVRGAGQVGEQQKKTGRQVNDELFAKILSGRGK